MATQAAVMTPPSARAHTLVRGAFDLHVHIAPDVSPRRIDDVSLARRFQENGLAGFGLKSHYTSTAERAQVVSAVTGLEVVGSVTLNQAGESRAGDVPCWVGVSGIPCSGRLGVERQTPRTDGARTPASQ